MTNPVDPALYEHLKELAAAMRESRPLNTYDS